MKVHCSTIYHMQIMETTQISINRGMDIKMEHIDTMEYYFVPKRINYMIKILEF